MKKVLLKLKIYLKPFLNWRFAITYFLVWSWHIILYIGIAFGLKFGIKWMYSTCMAIYGILWLPFCNENIFQIPLAMWLHPKLFKNDEKTMDQFKKLKEEANEDWAKVKKKFKRR